MRLVCLVNLLLLACFATAPRNPHLSHSVWPIVHHDSYSQGSTDIPSLTYADVTRNRYELDWVFDISVSGTLSIYWRGLNSSVAWGSGVHTIFKIDTGANPMLIIDAVLKPRNLVATDIFRGIYSVVSNERVFYSAIGNLILACTDTDPEDPHSKIKPLGAFELDKSLFQPEEAIMSLNILYSGEIAFLTNKGKVGVVDRDLHELIDLTTLAFDPMFINIPEAESLLHSSNLRVSNSMTIDQYGGLYVVSSKFLHRLFFDSEAKTIHSVLPGKSMLQVVVQIPSDNDTAHRDPFGQSTRVVWATPYETESEALPDRLSAEGSGTSPTVFELNRHLFVAVCDGQIHQNIVIMNALTGQIVASAPVDFGVLSPDQESFTEQSILVHDADLLVVQNALTPVGKRLNRLLDKWDPLHYLEMGNAPQRFTNHPSLAPVVLGDSSRGLQKFRFVALPNASYRLQSEWATDEFGCPNSIPTMSSATNIIYCVGKGSRTRLPLLKLARPSKKQPTPLSLPYPEGFEGGWVISGIDWTNGSKLFDIRTGSDLRFNSLFAAVQIGPTGEIVHGSMGGIIRIRKLNSSEAARQAQT